MPSSLSMRRFTDSFAIIALTVKCLPTSRMNSMAPSFVSHSALLTRRAGAARALEIEEARELRANPGDVRLNLLERQQRALGGLEAWIADQTGAAADHRDRRVTEPLQARQRQNRQQVADVKARRGRVEAGIHGDGFARQDVAKPLGRVVHEPAPLKLAIQVHQPLL